MEKGYICTSKIYICKHVHEMKWKRMKKQLKADMFKSLAYKLSRNNIFHMLFFSLFFVHSFIHFISFIHNFLRPLLLLLLLPNLILKCTLGADTGFPAYLDSAILTTMSTHTTCTKQFIIICTYSMLWYGSPPFIHVFILHLCPLLAVHIFSLPATPTRNRSHRLNANENNDLSNI